MAWRSGFQAAWLSFFKLSISITNRYFTSPLSIRSYASLMPWPRAPHRARPPRRLVSAIALAGAGVALLPAWAQVPLGLPHLPLAERAIALPVGGAATQVIRWALQHPHEPPKASKTPEAR